MGLCCAFRSTRPRCEGIALTLLFASFLATPATAQDHHTGTLLDPFVTEINGGAPGVPSFASSYSFLVG